ncbi:hypothetical protein PTMSG1_08773 [Pyrenophora teres f. maculata]|nr:hypothetical protein PTMSG1_08773 [Pyrenophora teres f. maculata]
MIFTQTLLLAVGIASVAAAPAPAPAPKPIMLEVDDVILHGNGRAMVMKRSEFDLLEKLRNSPELPPAPAGWDGEKVVPPKVWDYKKIVQSRSVETGNRTTRDIPMHERHGKRKITTIAIPRNSNRFLGWDVPMSNVAKGLVTISVSRGFSAANSVSFGVRGELSPIPTIFSLGGSAEVGRTWTTTDTNTFIGPVPEGKYGAFVSNPWTTRITGDIWVGTIGGGGTITPYQIDKLESKQYGELSWVDGLISICAKPEFPLTRCLGGGLV